MVALALGLSTAACSPDDWFESKGDRGVVGFTIHGENCLIGCPLSTATAVAGGHVEIVASANVPLIGRTLAPAVAEIVGTRQRARCGDQWIDAAEPCAVGEPSEYTTRFEIAIEAAQSFSLFVEDANGVSIDQATVKVEAAQGLALVPQAPSESGLQARSEVFVGEVFVFQASAFGADNAILTHTSLNLTYEIEDPTLVEEEDVPLLGKGWRAVKPGLVKVRATAPGGATTTTQLLVYE